jgi:uncharacterized protein (TIGR00369 family)
VDKTHHERESTALHRQPNSRHCFVCGLESAVGLKVRFDDNGVDEVQVKYTVDDQYQGYPGVVHGGVVAAMLDEVAGRVMMIDDHNRFFMTARMTLRYRRPVPTETELTMVGRLVSETRRAVQAHAEVRLPDGSVAAEAEVMLVPMIDGTLPDDDLEALGWRVYEDGSDS